MALCVLHSQPLKLLLLYVCLFGQAITVLGRHPWPGGLRRGSTAVRLLGLWVRIPPRYGCLSVVSVVCCQVEVSASG